MKKLKRSPISLLLLMSSTVWATDPDPKVVNTTGGILKNATMVVEYSVGEIAITSLNGTNGKVTQGYLQPIKNVITALPNETNESMISFYPNPTQNLLFFGKANEPVKLANIYTMDGKKIASFERPETNISLENLTQGVYQVELIGNQNQILTNTKIVKQ
jgi:hypothetical protein